MANVVKFNKTLFNINTVIDLSINSRTVSSIQNKCTPAMQFDIYVKEATFWSNFFLMTVSVLTTQTLYYQAYGFLVQLFMAYDWTHTNIHSQIAHTRYMRIPQSMDWKPITTNEPSQIKFGTFPHFNMTPQSNVPMHLLSCPTVFFHIDPRFHTAEYSKTKHTYI
jgi:hypothetical protein